MKLPETDTGIYVISGAFAIAVFVVAVALVVTLTAVDVSTRTVLTLTVGFLGFMAVYFVAWAVYRGIERSERGE